MSRATSQALGPWSPMLLPVPPYLRELPTGQAISETITSQVPPAEQATGHTYELWAATRFSRPHPEHPEGADSLWLRLETGPIRLEVTSPASADRLVGELEASRDGWRLRVTDPAGRTPAGPLWGVLEAASPDSASVHTLQESLDATWSDTWNADMHAGEIIARAWVAAPGYVTAAVAQTVPGTGDARPTFGAPQPAKPQTFTSLGAAQAALDVPLHQMSELPEGSALERVKVETSTSEDHRWTDVSQMYRLPKGSWLELTQMTTTARYAGAGWGQARYAPEARPVTVGQTEGYVIRRFGWWVLDWKGDDVGFELRAPVEAFSLEELLSLAATAEPLEKADL